MTNVLGLQKNSEYVFINDEIYFKLEKQPPRQQDVYGLEIRGEKAYFYDELGNDYKVSVSELTPITQ
jgi:hypothetical protein